MLEITQKLRSRLMNTLLLVLVIGYSIMADVQKMALHFTEQATRDVKRITSATYRVTRQKNGHTT
jgi:hypothetical protein